MKPFSVVYFLRTYRAIASFAVALSLLITSLTLIASSLLAPQIKVTNAPLLTISSLDYQPLNLSSFQLLANQISSQIYSAAFNDVSPGFDDLYIIKTQDKGREIIIYCNTNYCYKNRNSLMTS